MLFVCTSKKKNLFRFEFYFKARCKEDAIITTFRTINFYYLNFARYSLSELKELFYFLNLFT